MWVQTNGEQLSLSLSDSVSLSLSNMHILTGHLEFGQGELTHSKRYEDSLDLVYAQRILSAHSVLL